MFQKLITYSIRHKLVVGVFTIALVIWGIVSLIHLPFDSTPDITDNQVQVITQAPSLGAQEVEQYVTTPVEMALANIPELKERRSISRSGLSVITLVFDDDADIYWARSQVSQMLTQVEKDLPKNVETEMGPIATGLGEIYHYTVRAEKGYEHKYSLTQLRTIQDWIVRKQLSGTPGVTEVSGWGGYVKQYEVAINTDKLNASNLTVSEVFDALEKNNANTGGSYIEENSNQYFIRGIGVVKSLEDVANIAVKTVNGTPIKIGDVAKVQLGHATRFGAVTRNGEGEVVAGIAIMLKGENFQEVIRNVKLRIEQIQKSLPEGVVIEPFIDRTHLVDRVEGTIARNLIEGGLIVIFVLVIFLGNWRAGLVVASVIPLSMLFAFGMMKTFGIDGNLMSLGAIDFGMIVDSAVIIVEAVVAHLGVKSIERKARNSADTPIRFSQAEMDEEVHDSASRIRKSAAFGEIIIMIVYIPLMTLVGIEGKMFRPMALTVFFAILGAFILSLTYVPMASALFLSKKGYVRKTFSDRMIEKLQGWYRPVLEWVLARYKNVITGAVSLFCMSAVAFHFLGGEFIPSLEEGNFAVEMSMSQGTSLSQMVESCSKAEKLLKAEYPEIKQVVSRIGSAEIPTDPMPMERADIMVALKPKAEWTSAETTAELMEKMEETLKTIPGLKAEISQPIQMRNNELLTGIKQDVAIKIFGDNLDVLTQQADKVSRMIRNVPGVSGIFVEEVSGLPQIQVKYNHERIAAYGVTVDEINRILETTFAGATAGAVYEGDKKFDIVLRLDPKERNFQSLQSLRIPLAGGESIPLSQLADVVYEPAPAQVSHENGARRIYVGFNVKGRDVQSKMRYKAGESRQLEYLSADRKCNENRLEMADVKSEIERLQIDLMTQLNTQEPIKPAEENLSAIAAQNLNSYNYQQSADGIYQQDKLIALDKEIKAAKSGFAPSLSLSLRTQCVISSWNPYNIDRSRFAEGNFFGFEIGVGIPLFYGSTKAKVKAAQKDRELAEIEMRQEQTEKERDFRLCTKRLQAASNRLKYYEQNNQAHSAQISKLSAIEYENGEISYVEYVNAIEETIAVLMKHADAINEYNQAVIAIQRLTGMM